MAKGIRVVPNQTAGPAGSWGRTSVPLPTYSFYRFEREASTPILMLFDGFVGLNCKWALPGEGSRVS